jgi:hypothetical protein
MDHSQPGDIRQCFLSFLSVTNDMSGFVTHDLSGLIWSPMEVTDETDGDTTGEPEDAI